MLKQLLKKFIPVTYNKLESDHSKLYKEMELLIASLDNSFEQSKSESRQQNKSALQHLDTLSKEIRQTQEALDHQHLETEQLVQLIQQISETCAKFSERINDNEIRFEKELSHNLSPIMQAEKRLENAVSLIDRKYLYHNDYERRISQTFYEAYEREDYGERFVKLIENMEPESVSTVVTILQRQQLIKGFEGKSQDIFSLDEQKQLKELRRQLTSEVYRVNDHLFCYKHYMLPVKHFEASVFIYKHGIDCISNLEALRDKDIFDVGGFIGDSLLVLKPLTNRRIYSFEPVRENFEIMKQTVQLNHMENVILENAALDAFVGEKTIIKAGSSSSFYENSVVQTCGNEVVQTNTLDNYIKDKDIDIGLIKVDVEGDEQAFLAGARKAIEHFRPVLLLSIYHNADDFFDIKPLIESWRLGYKFRIHKPLDYSVSREVLLIAEVR